MPTMTKTQSERLTFYKTQSERPGFRQYSEFDERFYVPEDVRTAAATALTMAARELGITDPLLILWYVADDDADKGFTHWSEPQIVFVRATKDYREAMAVVAHEVKHLAQFKDGYKGQGGGPAVTAKEIEADSYHRQFMTKFWPR